MNPRTLVNIALAIAVAMAGAALYFWPEPATEPTYPLVPVAENDLREIEIRRTAAAPIVLARDGSGPWRMKAPLPARLDDIALGRILDIARLQSTTRMPAEDLARFELDKPWARVRFGQYTIELGMSNAMTHELYVKSGEHVHVVNARIAAALPADPAKLMAHRLFAADEMPIGFRLARFTLRHDGTRWQLEPGDPGLSQDDLVRWVDQWRLASSIVTQPRTAADAHERITATLRGGREVPLTITARTPDFVVTRDDEGLEYHLPARLGALLLASPSATAAKPP